MLNFFFHFNKPESKKKQKPQISVHYKKTCYIVDNVVCNVKTTGRVRKKQPLFVMAGKCKDFKIVDKVAVIS